MSLRAKLLALFAAVAVAPLCAVGLVNHVQAMRALEALLARQTGALAERAAHEIADRYAVQQSDLLLLAENWETQRLLRAEAARDSAAMRAARATAEPYFDQLWQQFSSSYHAVALRDRGGAVILRLGDPALDGDPTFAAPGAEPRLVFEQPIVDATSGERLGTVTAWPAPRHLLPPEALAAQFGGSGYTAVVDRATGRILYHSLRGDFRRSAAAVLGVEPAALRAEEPADFRFREGDTLRIASVAPLADPAWSVLATTAVDEFSPPFARMRTTNLLLLLLVLLSVSTAFGLAIRRGTRSLAELTRAADAVGRGDFAPPLPPAGNDEIGRLTSAFRLMTAKVREMMEQIERDRQMAAIGEFAAEIAHEIRNPLTSVKLNLQRIERRVRGSPDASAASVPLEISLREINRLERVVRGILHLGRPRRLSPTPCSLHAVVREAVETVRAEAEPKGVRIGADLAAGEDRVRGDSQQLKGALLNVLLNAVEAMPQGGFLRIATEVLERNDGTDAIVVRVADSGPGISAAERDRLFRPFHTTKPHGTGLGLAMALRTAQEHGGTLSLEASSGGPGGAVFRLELPLAAERVPA